MKSRSSTDATITVLPAICFGSARWMIGFSAARAAKTISMRISRELAAEAPEFGVQTRQGL
jgi:hypothetical protein